MQTIKHIFSIYKHKSIFFSKYIFKILKLEHIFFFLSLSLSLSLNHYQILPESFLASKYIYILSVDDFVRNCKIVLFIYAIV